MKKVLLPSIVMVSVYLAIQIIALSIPTQQKKQTKHASVLVDRSPIISALLRESKSIKDTPPKLISTGPTTITKINNQTFTNGGNVKKDQLLDLSLLPERSRVQFQNFNENSGKPIEINYERTGTTISIPANAFVSQSGDPVKGEVEIRYREFIKPSEIFTSDIPMHWQGDEYLESAGMFQIEAWQDGQKLELAPGVELEIAMTSTFKDQNYNLYAFNDDNQNWSYVNNNFSYEEAPQQNMDNDDWRLISNDSLPQYVSVKKEYYVPVANVVGFNPNYQDALHKQENTIYRQASVELQYKSDLFPELEVLGTYKYKIFTHNYSELEKIANTVMDRETNMSLGWKDIKITYPGKWGLVDLNFINDLDSFILGAEPILENKSQQKKYLAAYSEYAAKYEPSRLARLSIKRTKMVMKKVDFEKDTLIVQELKRMKMAEKVERKFLVGKLMTWNCDRPFPIKPYEPYMVSITNERVSNVSMVYAAIPGKNSVFKATDFKHFPLVNECNMYLWILIDENTVGYITPDMLKEHTWDKLNVNDLEMRTMSLDAFLPILDREILRSSETLTEII